ncbi:hypothetical protein BDW22DRAFT_1191588 [Trametopsis cervina]|nr:hypothetical protein BDW22DRAFT_1191588 [Trametopsis cervina]
MRHPQLFAAKAIEQYPSSSSGFRSEPGLFRIYVMFTIMLCTGCSLGASMSSMSLVHNRACSAHVSGLVSCLSYSELTPSYRRRDYQRVLIEIRRARSFASERNPLRTPPLPMWARDYRSLTLISRHAPGESIRVRGLCDRHREHPGLYRQVTAGGSAYTTLQRVPNTRPDPL